MNLDMMAIFAKAAETRNFSRAARELGLPKSNISRKIARYEEELAVRLFERSTHETRLTEAGRALYERCIPLLNAAEAAESYVKSMQSAPKGTLKVAASIDLGLFLARDFFAEFCRQYPAIKVTLHLSYRYANLVKEGYDVGIRVGNLKDAALISRRLATTRSGLYASPAYLKASGTPRTPADLARHQGLRFDGPPSFARWTLRKERRVAKVKVQSSFACDHFQGLKNAALAGMGIVLFPERLVRSEIRDGHLVRILPGWTTDPIGIQAVYPSRRLLSPKARVFLDALANYRGLW